MNHLPLTSDIQHVGIFNESGWTFVQTLNKSLPIILKNGYAGKGMNMRPDDLHISPLISKI